VNPDIAIFAKAMGNGHPIAAVIGTREAMDGAHESFISSTYWTEALGYAAALATIDKIEKTRAWEHVKKIGTIVQADWEALGKKHGLKVRSFGLPCLSHFAFEEHSLELKTLYSRLMLEEGFLGNTGFYPTLAHNEEILAKHREAVDRVFFRMAETLKKGGVEAVMEKLDGRLCETDFRRLIK
jgi:4-aminobutyrate aminotransferase-like enzyme